MTTATPTHLPNPSKTARLTGRILAALLCLWMIPLPLIFMATNLPEMKKHLGELGLSPEQVVPINLLCITFATLFAIPKTAILGALFLTAYLGGAAFTHVRSHDYLGLLFPILFAALIWTSLLLREPRLRALLPLR